MGSSFDRIERPSAMPGLRGIGSAPFPCLSGCGSLCHGRLHALPSVEQGSCRGFGLGKTFL